MPIEPKRKEAAARAIYSAGIHHGWWHPRSASFEQFKAGDPIGFSEFLAIVADSLVAAYPELASDPPTAWVAPVANVAEFQGMIVCAHPDMPVHVWDGLKMTRLEFGVDMARDAHTKEQT